MSSSPTPPREQRSIRPPQHFASPTRTQNLTHPTSMTSATSPVKHIPVARPLRRANAPASRLPSKAAASSSASSSISSTSAPAYNPPASTAMRSEHGSRPTIIQRPSDAAIPTASTYTHLPQRAIDTTQRPALAVETSGLTALPAVPPSQSDPRNRNVLRRKRSVIGQYMLEQRGKKVQAVPAAPVAPVRPPSATAPSPALSSSRQFADGGVYGRYNGVITPLSHTSGTPSLTHCDTPSVFSHDTPNSRPSYSPHIEGSPHFGQRAWTGSAKHLVSPMVLPENDQYRSPLDASEHPFFRQTNASTSSINAKPSKSKPSLLRKPQPKAKTEILTGKNSSQISLSQRYEKVTPPELAHLLLDAQPPQSPPKDSTPVSPPRRPSRDGTPRLDESSATFPVVQSNISRLPGVNRPQLVIKPTPPPATSQLMSPAPISADAAKHTTAVPTKRVSRIAQPKRENSFGSTSEKTISNPPAVSRRTQSDVKPTKTSRFGFFSRKSKAASDNSAEIASAIKKGTVASEGSATTGVKRTSQSSANSNAADPAGKRRSAGSAWSNGSSSKQEKPLDDFLQQRLSPVYLRSESYLQSPESSNTVDDRGISSPQSERADLSPRERDMSTTASPISVPTTPDAQIVSPSIESRLLDATKNIGMDLEAQRPATSAGEAVEHRFNTTKALPRRSSSDDIPRAVVEAEPKLKQKKSGWSLFPRPGSSKSMSPEKTNASTSNVQSSPVKSETPPVPALAPQKSFAHYELFNTGSPIAFEELESIMQEADAAYMEGRNSPASSKNVHIDLLTPWGHLKARDGASISSEGTSFLHSSENLPQLAQQQEQQALQSQAATTTSQQPVIAAVQSQPSAEPSGPPPPAPRQSRLPQVGRIPKVISRRDHERKLPEHSFSRPFATSEHRPNFSKGNIVIDDQPVKSALDTLTGDVPLSPMAPLSRDSKGFPKDFFAFPPPRKGSQASQSTTASSSILLPSLPWVAAERLPGSPPSEDEVWSEYDDLLDNVLSPIGSKASSIDASNMYASPSGSRRLSPVKNALPTTAPALSTPLDDQSFLLLPKPLQFDDRELSPMHSGSPILNSARLASIEEQPSATTSPSVSKFVSGYADRNLDPNHAGLPPIPYSPSIYSPRGSAVLRHEKSTSLPKNAFRQSDQSTSSSAGSSSRNSLPVRPNPQSMANLRFGALMVSKWLSFGRVLFSPIHFQLEDPQPSEHRILVIDGLGKDWSYYCALTYSNAQVYSLNIEGPNTGPAKNRNSLGSGFKSLPNHRHVAHESLTTDLPFPQHFFSTVVFRFPEAMPDTTLRGILTEAKRVLVPGGFLEITALDLDLTNMGPVCRRTVRHLKMAIQAADPQLSLMPASDSIQHALGRRGFENLSRCVVGVPAAGSLAPSPRHSAALSFTELVNDPSPDSDSHITKMVARVGRWWYARAYEARTLPGGDLAKSVFTDTELLKECEAHGTAFKLLIAYAQKPRLAKRRTRSF